MKNKKRVLSQNTEGKRIAFGVRWPGIRLTPYLLPLSFFILIVLGTILLAIPPATSSSGTASPIDAFFTATSAVCVTGLVVVETGSYWSSFGQAVILVLIQLGGFGIMTGVTLILLAVNGRISIGQRIVLTQSLGGHGNQALSSTVKNMARFFLFSELTGALILFFSIFRNEPLPTAAWMSIFHSIASFNNSGFDIFPSMTSVAGYQGDVLFILTTALLIILGGISFFVVRDISQNRRFGKFSTDTKMVVVITLALLLAGWIVIFFSESLNSSTLAGGNLSGRILNSFFLSVTTRTAGFSTFSLANATTLTFFLSCF